MKTKLSGILTLLMALIVHISFAQDKTISGTVTDADGLPLPGVNVLVEGTSNGTQSDFDGKYTINASTGQTLLFTYIGQKNVRKAVGAGNTIDVQMVEDAQALEEVVVTGVAGATSKAKVAISIATVGEDLISNVPATSAASAIQGKIAGVTVTQPSGLPGSSAVINIRGVTSLLGNQTPLIIVDGVLLASANLADLNTEDIKSYEILKGAAAASLYGSRAANGVVQIITKRGLRNQAPEVTFRQELGVNSILRGYESAQFHNYVVNGDGSFALSDPADPASLIADIPDGLTVNHSVLDNKFPAYFDNFNDAFTSGIFRTSSASVSGGSAGMNYFASFQDSENQGIINIGNQGFKRQTGKINLDVDITDKLKFSTSNTYTNSRNFQPALGSGGPLYALQFAPPHFNLSENNQEDGSRYNWNPFADNSSGGWPTLETNPFYYLDNYLEVDTRQRFISNAKLKYQANDWLSFEASYGLDNLWSQTNIFVDKNWLDDQNSTFINGNITQSNFNFRNETVSFNTFTNNSFGDLDVNTRLQYLTEVENFNSLSVSGSELVNTGVNNLENVVQATLNVGSSKTKEVAKSYSGILNLIYKDRYIFDGLARFEQVSSYGPLARDQWFSRFSGAYRLGMDLNVDWIDELKFRGSYGSSGLRPPLAAQFEVVDVANGNNTKSTIGNASLGASVSTETEFGVDFNFLNRFRTSFNYSNTVNEDLIIVVPLPAATGFSEQYQNAAATESQVFEATLGIDLIKSENTNWNFNAIFSKFETEITEFNRADLQVGPSNAFILREGEIYGTFYGKRFLTSLDQLPSTANPADFTIYNGIVVTNDGTNSPQKLIDEESGVEAIVPIGNTTPDFNLAFNTTFSYKNFSIFAVVDWSSGGDVYNQTKQWKFRELLDPEIDGETVGWASGLYSINEVNDFFVEDATYVKLRELALNYRLNPKFLDKTFLKDVSFSLVGRNLFIISDYSGVDPEVSNIDTGSDGRFNDLSAFKFDAFGYPSTKTISGAITLKF